MINNDNVLPSDVEFLTQDIVVGKIVSDVVMKNNALIKAEILSVDDINASFLKKVSNINNLLLDLNNVKYDNIIEEIIVNPVVNNSEILSIDVPVYDHNVSTDMSLNTNSPSNNDVLSSYEKFETIPNISPGSGNIFPTDPNELPRIDNLNTLLQYLSEIMMRFNSNPRYYIQDDFAILVRTITDSLIDLYLRTPVSTGQLQDLINQLYLKVDKHDTDRLITLAEALKLQNIEDGAQVNKIEVIKVNGVEQVPNNKEIDINVSTDTFYKFTQGSASSEWDITHNLNKYPSVTVVDSGGSVVEGEIDYVDLNNLKVLFSAGFSGVAYLN